MALPSSGQLTFSAIATELGIAGYSYNGVDMRGMSSDAGFSTPDSISEFYGYSNAYTETQTVTVGYFNDSGAYIPSETYGFQATTNAIGSISDGTFNAKSGADIDAFAYNTLEVLRLDVDGNQTNADWTQFVLNGVTFTRASSNHAYNSTSGLTTWSWTSITNNPFGTTTGATKAAVFT